MDKMPRLYRMNPFIPDKQAQRFIIKTAQPWRESHSEYLDLHKRISKNAATRASPWTHLGLLEDSQSFNLIIIFQTLSTFHSGRAILRCRASWPFRSSALPAEIPSKR